MVENAVVSLEEIEMTTKEALVNHGASSKISTLVAQAVRSAESKGNKIFGLYYVESYCLQLETGRVDGSVEPIVTNVKSGVVRVNGRFGFAQSAFKAGFDKAIEVAKDNGICSYSIEHTQTCTSLGYFTEQLAEAGMLTIGATNASAVVAPPGGSIPLLGTNPIAMSVPNGKGGVAFQFDFSTSAIALGKITMAAEANQQIPLGWAVDKHGNPTTDPNDALEGSLLSTGGYKGYGFGLMSEILATGLSGAVSAMVIGSGKTSRTGGTSCHYFCAYNIEAFTDVEIFKDNMDNMLQSLKDTPPAPGHERVMYPGLSESEEEEERKINGIPLHSEVVEWFTDITSELTIPMVKIL